MENKKETKTQLERRMKNALVFVTKDKEYRGIYFSDKGVRLEVTSEHAVISTGYHQHVFFAATSNGMSRPYIYTKQFIKIAYEHDCVVKDKKGNASYSYSKLLNVLREAKDEAGKTDYLIAFYVDMWLQNIFSPLYMIDNTEAASFLTYLDYCCGLARNVLLLSEHKEDVTNKQFVKKFTDKLFELTEGNEERVILHKLTDDERLKQEMDAIAETESEISVEQSSNNDGGKYEETK